MNRAQAAGTALAVFAAFGAAAQKQTIKIASVAPNRSPWDVEQRKLAQEWVQISGGDATLQFFDTQAIGSENGVIQKLRSARPGQRAPLDGAVFTCIGIHELAPEAHILTLCVPFTFKTQAEVDYVLEAVSGDIQKAVQNKGYVLLGCFGVGWIYFSTKEPVRTPEKLKDLRLAMGGFGSPEFTAALKTAGYKVENIPLDKISQNIRSPGGVQGVYAIPMYTYAMKYHETLRYVLDLPICPVFTAFIMSEPVWDSFSAPYRTQLLEAVKKSERVFSSMQQETDERYLTLMEQSGVTRAVPTAAELAAWEKSFTEDAQKMLDGNNAILDRAFYRRILALLAEYRKQNGGG